jgi:mono/diheme cytochrome c family protein
MNKKLTIGLVVLSLSLAAVPSARADGASDFKSKCASCHGPNGEGKMGPALKGTSLSADDIVKLLREGDPQKKSPHNKPRPHISEAKAKALADYIKTLQ